MAKGKIMLSTEEKIKSAAVQVFTEKGYAATKTRDIAEAAGINIASLHYYFRSKEKLFYLVIQEAMERFSKLMDGILDSDKPLHEKIKHFAVMYIDFIKENPFLPMFILSESNKDPQKIDQMMKNENHMTVLQKQIDELVASKIIRPISIDNFFSNLMGLIVFPFLSKPLMKIKTGLDDQGFEKMLEERKQMIPEMVIGYLYYAPPQEHPMP